MADDHAKISLTVDASGAKAGLEEVKRVGDGLIGVARAVDAAQEKSATTTEQTEARKKVARGGGAKAAKELAEAEQDAAKRAGAGVAEATERILTSLSSQKRALDNNARAWDPLGAAAERAAHKIEVLFDIIAKKGPNAERAAGQVAQAVERAVAAASAANGTTQRQADKERLTEIFDPATASAKRMVAELAELNKAFQLGENIEGGYTAAYQKIVDKYDEGAMAAKRAAVAQRELIEGARAAQAALDAQSSFNQQLGVNRPGQANSARDSASVFEAAFAAEEDAAAGLKHYEAELSRLRAMFDPLTVSAKAMTAELRDLNKAQASGVPILGGYAAEYQRIIDKYDEGAQAAQRAVDAQKRAAEAQQSVIEQARASQAAQNAQSFFGQKLGIQEPDQRKSASESASVFQEQFAAEEKLLAERKALTAEFDPLTTKTLAYQAALERIKRAVDIGIISDKQADVERKKALGTLDGSTEALKKQEAEIKALTAEFAPLKAAEEAHLATLDRIKQAMALGVINDTQAETQRTQATKSFELQKKAIETHGHSAGQAAFAQRQFNVQMVQLFSSIESGQPILLSMIQQIHQMVDVALATGTGFSVVGTAIKSAFGAIFSPIGVIVGVAGALAVLAYRSEETARRIGALRQQLGGIRDDAPQASQMAEEAAKHLAATTPLHYTDAFKGAGEILKVPEFHGTKQQLEELLQTADKLSIQMNEDMPAGLQRLTQAMEHPSQAAQELVRHIKGFDQPLVNEIKRMEDAGRTADAFNLYLAAVNRATRDATREVTPLQEALEKLTEAFSGAWHGSHSFADELGTNTIGAMVRLVNVMKEGLEEFKQIADWIDAHTPGWAMELLKNVPGGRTPEEEKAGPPSAQQGAQQMVVNNQDAIGLFQLRRDAATDVGMTVPKKGVTATPENDQRFNYNMNLIGGERYFRQQFEATGGNLDTATRAYNQGLGGAQKGLGFDYLAKVKAQDPNKLPPEVKKDIEDAFYNLYSDIARTAAGPEVLRRIEQIAMQENRGHHFETGYRSGTPGEGALGGRDQVTPQELQIKRSGMSDQDKVDQALNATRNMGVEPVERTKALGLIEKIREAMEVLSKQNKQGTAQWIELSRGLEIAQLQFQEAIEPADKLTHSLDRGTAGTTRLTDAYRKNAESVAYVTAHNRALEEARTLAAEGTQKNIELVETLTQKYLAEADATQQQELTKQVTDINFLIEGQGRLNAAYEQSTAAGIQMTIQLKAEADARALARAGLANYADAVKLLTERNLALAQSQAVGQVKQQMLVNDNQITLINAETKALTMASGEREAYLAKVRSEIFLKEKGLSTNDAVAQGLIKSNQALAAGTLAAQNQKKALDEITQTGEQIFGTLEKGLTEPLRDGETAAQRFGSVMTSVLADIEKELLKLAVINPIMNALFGGEHRPEIGDVGGLFGGKDGKGGGPLALLAAPFAGLGKLFGFGGSGGGGPQGVISSDAGGGIADKMFDASLGKQLMDATGGTAGIVKGMNGNWTITPGGAGAAPAAAPVLATPTNQNAVTAPGGGNFTTSNPALQGLTPAQIIQQEHDAHERSMGGQRSDLGVPSTVKIPARLDQPAMSIPVPDSGQIDKAPVFGQPGSFDPQGMAATSVGDNLTVAFDDFMKKTAAPGATDNAGGVGDNLSRAFDDYLKTSGGLANSTDKLVNSLGDQVDTIKDQVGSIDNLVNSGQNQVSAIGNLIAVIGSGGGGPGGGGPGGGGGIIGSLVDSVGGKGFYKGGGLIGSLFGGGDGMASGGDLSALTSEAASNISAGAAGLHGGGLVGYDPPTFTRMVDPAMFAHAPRMHSGLGANEFAAILEKGERVLTGQQQKQVHAAANNNNGGGGHNFTFNFPADASPDGFRRAGHQVATQVQSSLARAKARNSI